MPPTTWRRWSGHHAGPAINQRGHAQTTGKARQTTEIRRQASGKPPKTAPPTIATAAPRQRRWTPINPDRRKADCANRPCMAAPGHAAAAPTLRSSSACGKRIWPTISSAWATSRAARHWPAGQRRSACRVSSKGRLTAPGPGPARRPAVQAQRQVARALTVGFIAVLGRSVVAPQDIRRPVSTSFRM